MTETNRIEYKRELTPELDIEKEVVAFLNYKEGGYIYIGIDKDGSTVGVSDVDDCMLRLKDRIKHNISPSAMGLFDIAEEQKYGRSIIKVTEASGIEKPYFKTNELASQYCEFADIINVSFLIIINHIDWVLTGCQLSSILVPTWCHHGHYHEHL